MVQGVPLYTEPTKKACTSKAQKFCTSPPWYMELKSSNFGLSFLYWARNSPKFRSKQITPPTGPKSVWIRAAPGPGRVPWSNSGYTGMYLR